jgi:hypothetical protein
MSGRLGLLNKSYEMQTSINKLKQFPILFVVGGAPFNAAKRSSISRFLSAGLAVVVAKKIANHFEQQIWWDPVTMR